MVWVGREQEIFGLAGIPIWLKPYKIISTGNSTGLIQVGRDTMPGFHQGVFVMMIPPILGFALYRTDS